MRNPRYKSAQSENEICLAIFATDTLGFSPEWFARIGGELYLAGLNSTNIPLPDIATEVKASEKAIEQLKQCAKAMILGVPGKDIEVLRESLVSTSHLFRAKAASNINRSASVQSRPVVGRSYRGYLTRSSEG